jgi:hypothetical protein
VKRKAALALEGYVMVNKNFGDLESASGIALLTLH